MTNRAGKTFLITGVSTGLGRAFAVGALQAGHTVAGTVRRRRDAEAFWVVEPERAHPYVLDVTDDLGVVRVVNDIESKIGPIDVLISNAGYAHEGLIEESTMQQLRDQFAVNVFGSVAVIKAVLPHMRRRRAGHILTVTSMGGLITFPGLGFYHGSKYALEGLTETVGKEVAGLGIHVTAIEPGGFRTDWAGRSMVRAERLIPDYDSLFDPLRANRARGSGYQLGDPAKAAQAMLRILDVPDPPAHLILGSDALRLVAAGQAAVSADFRRWGQLSRSTDSTDSPDLGRPG
jgi:NAD(P)-dependent dehydrogenase (short-subunit alcohol dehydrogenase family)